MSSDKVLSSSSSSNYTNEYLNNFTTSLSKEIKFKLDNDIMSDENTKILHKVLNKIQTDTEFLNVIIDLNTSLLNLDVKWNLGASSVLNDTTDSTAKLVNILIPLLI